MTREFVSTGTGRRSYLVGGPLNVVWDLASGKCPWGHPLEDCHVLYYDKAKDRHQNNCRIRRQELGRASRQRRATSDLYAEKERRRVAAIELFELGLKAAEIAEQLSVTPHTVRAWRRTWKAGGSLTAHERWNTTAEQPEWRCRECAAPLFAGRHIFGMECK